MKIPLKIDDKLTPISVLVKCIVYKRVVYMNIFGSNWNKVQKAITSSTIMGLHNSLNQKYSLFIINLLVFDMIFIICINILNIHKFQYKSTSISIVLYRLYSIFDPREFHKYLF